jgi:hypothetical protein
MERWSAGCALSSRRWCRSSIERGKNAHQQVTDSRLREQAVRNKRSAVGVWGRDGNTSPGLLLPHTGNGDLAGHTRAGSPSSSPEPRGAGSSREGSPFRLVSPAFEVLAYLLLAFALPPRLPLTALPQHATQTHATNDTTAARRPRQPNICSNIGEFCDDRLVTSRGSAGGRFQRASRAAPALCRGAGGP